MRKYLTKFSRVFECGAEQKFVNLVDLVKSFPTTIYLQRFVSIQPRTSLSKFAKNWQKVRKKVRTFIGRGSTTSRSLRSPGSLRAARRTRSCTSGASTASCWAPARGTGEATSSRTEAIPNQGSRALSILLGNVEGGKPRLLTL